MLLFVLFCLCNSFFGHVPLFIIHFFLSFFFFLLGDSFVTHVVKFVFFVTYGEKYGITEVDAGGGGNGRRPPPRLSIDDKKRNSCMNRPTK